MSGPTQTKQSLRERLTLSPSQVAQWQERERRALERCKEHYSQAPIYAEKVKDLRWLKGACVGMFWKD